MPFRKRSYPIGIFRKRSYVIGMHSVNVATLSEYSVNVATKSEWHSVNVATLLEWFQKLNLTFWNAFHKRSYVLGIRGLISSVNSTFRHLCPRMQWNSLSIYNSDADTSPVSTTYKRSRALLNHAIRQVDIGKLWISISNRNFHIK